MSDAGLVALVTGGSQGLGRAVCASLAQRGVNVAVNYRTSARDADDVVAELTEQGVDALAVRADVSDEDAVKAMIDAVLGRWGRLDLLINNGAYTTYVAHTDFAGLSADMWRRTFDVNVLGAWNTAKHAAAAMSASESAAMVNVASAAALYGTGSSIAYGASKAALIAMTKSLARALAPSVRVNAVAPGAIATDWFVNNGGGDAEAAQAQLERFAARTRLQRVPLVSEVAGAVAWLALDAGSMTGQTVTIDSGFGLPA